MHGGAELVADQAARVADRVGAAERETGGQRVERAAPGRNAGMAGLEHAVHFAVGDGMATDGDLGVEEVRADAAARIVDDDALHLHAGHAFGRVHRETDRALGGLHVHHGAALDAARALMTDPEDAAAMRAAAQHL